MRFLDRAHAARLLARRLSVDYQDEHPVVLGIPRGAVPMARIIADSLSGDLDVVLVRKLSHPAQPELAVGAIDESGNVLLMRYAAELDPQYLELEKQRQLEILQRRRAEYTPLRPPVDLHERLVIVVDDGIATGSTMIAALRALRARKARRLVAAVAVASQEAVRAVSAEADSTVCLSVPAKFHAVGEFFADFAQVDDAQVAELLRRDRAHPSHC